MYRFSNVISAQNKRHTSLNNDRYVEGMIFLLKDQFFKKKINVFRWFDSGDLQSIDHLDKIILIAQKMPYIKFWLPTQERDLILKRKDIIAKLDNLIIRVSATKIDGKPSNFKNTSSVVSVLKNATCLAYRTDKTKKIHSMDDYLRFNKHEKKALDFGHCGDCRKCWNKNIKNITYFQH
jgi:hypothetical protein